MSDEPEPPSPKKQLQIALWKRDQLQQNVNYETKVEQSLDDGKDVTELPPGQKYRNRSNVRLGTSLMQADDKTLRKEVEKVDGKCKDLAETYAVLISRNYVKRSQLESSADPEEQETQE